MYIISQVSVKSCIRPTAKFQILGIHTIVNVSGAATDVALAQKRLPDHEILLAKLQYYSIHGTPLELLKSYLTNRKQYVEIEDTKSKMQDISAGVP